MDIRGLVLVALLAFGAIAPGGRARAEDWNATVGARIRIKPPYEGAASHIVGLIPVLVIRPADHPYRFTPPDGAAALALIDSRLVVAGPVIRFRGSRSDDGVFAGLTRIPVATEPGLFVALWPTPWLRARIETRRGISGHRGWVEDLGLDLVHTDDMARGDRWDASIGLRAGYGDAHYMGTYFGVTPAEALVRLPRGGAYVPGAGLRYTGAAAAAAYHLDKRWTVNMDLTYNHLGSKALASPVVRTVGAGEQVSVGMGVTYSFGFKL
jgi:outer membrane protein